MVLVALTTSKRSDIIAKTLAELAFQTPPLTSSLSKRQQPRKVHRRRTPQTDSEMAVVPILQIEGETTTAGANVEKLITETNSGESAVEVHRGTDAIVMQMADTKIAPDGSAAGVATGTVMIGGVTGVATDTEETTEDRKGGGETKQVPILFHIKHFPSIPTLFFRIGLGQSPIFTCQPFLTLSVPLGSETSLIFSLASGTQGSTSSAITKPYSK